MARTLMGRGFGGSEPPHCRGLLGKGLCLPLLPQAKARGPFRHLRPIWHRVHRPLHPGLHLPQQEWVWFAAFFHRFLHHGPADDGFDRLRRPFRGGSLLLRRGAILGVNEGDGDVQSRSLCGEKRHFCGFGPGLGRAMGETMAVIMVLVNSPQMPTSLTQFVRTLASNIALSAAR